MEYWESKYWYAILKDDDDNDWGMGSYDYDEAVKMAKEAEFPIIDVIDVNGDPICVEEIRDF